MLHFARRSLLSQLLSVYLIFVAVVLLGGVAINTVIEQRLTANVQASDEALAQEIATQTSLQLTDAETSVQHLSYLVQSAPSSLAVENIFQDFQSGHSDVKLLYWLNSYGSIDISCSANTSPTLFCQQGLINAEFEPLGVITQAINKPGVPVYEVGMPPLGTTSTNTAGVMIAEGVCNAGAGVCDSSHLKGIVVVNISLEQLSEPLVAVVSVQRQQGRKLDISVVDDQGELVATPDANHILWYVANMLPGVEQGLRGQVASRVGVGTDGQDWLFSTVPVPQTGWAVTVQRPVSEALAVVDQFHLWLLIMALLFALGGLLFWLILLFRVIKPLHTLATRYQSLPDPAQKPPPVTTLASRHDEVGDLSHSLARLEQDGLQKLGELRTLLETSNEVVRSLEPHAVVRKIIQEARRLVDVQAAAVLLPDAQGVLRVLVSDGHSPQYDQRLALLSANVNSAAVLALRNSKPVQKLLGPGQASFSYDDGFRSVLAIPIISRHAGGVVLLVHRVEPHLFDQNEIDLLLTFANYATLAWEHAVLYERSDERLQEVARENEQLYRQASEEKQKLEALLAAVGHELRTPLAAIKGHASTLLQEDVTWSHDDQRHFLRTISGEADRMAQLVRNLLDLSRQEAGLLLLNREPVRLQYLVNKVIERLERPGVVLTTSIPADLPLVDVDSARIEVVLHNLVSNALVYGDGEVYITAERRAGLVVVSVTDNGPGIDLEDLPHIFKRFFRAQRGRQQRSGGTGLGLTICQAFVEAHGTTIWAENGEQGTTISFSLPCSISDVDVPPLQLPEGMQR